MRLSVVKEEHSGLMTLGGGLDARLHRYHWTSARARSSAAACSHMLRSHCRLLEGYLPYP